MINSAASYWKKEKKLKLKALFTLNSNGENGITALADVSDFKGAGNGIADMFLLEGGDNRFTFFQPVFNLADAGISIGVFLLLIFYRKDFN